MDWDERIRKLARDLKSEDTWTRWNAASALIEIGNDLLGSGASRQSKEFLELCNVVVPASIEALENEDSYARQAAAWTLGGLGDTSAVPSLIKALGDNDEMVRKRAAEALDNILDNCKVTEVPESFEQDLKEGFAILRKKHPDKNELIEVKMRIAKVMKKVSEKKNELASKRDILLDVKPKPPKKGGMYRIARVRNGRS